MRKKYIECKNYEHKVPLEEVAKFKEVVSQNHIPKRKCLFVYKNELTERCKHIGIKTVKYSSLRNKVIMTVWGKRAVFTAAVVGAVNYNREIIDVYTHISDMF